MKTIKLDNKEYDTTSSGFSDKVMSAHGLSPVRDYVKNTLKQDVDWDGENVTLGGNAFIKPQKVYNGRSYAKTSELDNAAKEWAKNQGMEGVRDYAKNNLGMNNLGWNNGNITYKGQNFMTPTYTIAGTSYATPEAINVAADAYRANNKYVPVRQDMKGQGFYDKGIGYKDGNITYYGSNIGSPDMIQDGVSYMNPVSYDEMIKKLTEDDVDAASTLASMGISNGVEFKSDGTVSILGMPVNVSQLKTDENGKVFAHVNKNDFENAYTQYRKNNPTIQDVFNEYKNTYGNRVEKALSRIENQKDFEYDLDDDPQYKAYKAAAERNAQKAHEDTMARMQAMTGGMANSNAIVAAAQARDAHLDTLNDRIPELYRAAYDRYNADRQREFDRLDSALSAADRQYNNSFMTAVQLAQLVNSANNAEFQRRMEELIRGDSLKQAEVDNTLKTRQVDQGDRQLNQADAQYDLAEKQYEEGKRMNDENLKLALLELMVTQGSAGLGINNTFYNYAGQLLQNRIK